MPRPAAMRAAEALVTVAPAPRSDAYAGIGPRASSPAPTRNEERAREDADGIRAVLRDLCPLLGAAARSLVAVRHVGDAWLVEVCGVPLAGREDASLAAARRERLVAGLADAIENAWNEGVERAPSPDAGLRLAAGWRDRALAAALDSIWWSMPPHPVAIEDNALGALREAYQALTSDCVPEAEKAAARAFAARWLGVAVGREPAAAPAERDGWDLLRWRHHAEQIEEQRAFLARELERVRGILRAALEDQ